jgi:siroheme synthase (precorrin-2 oxidase/ferrochelatase)
MKDKDKILEEKKRLRETILEQVEKDLKDLERYRKILKDDNFIAAQEKKLKKMENEVKNINIDDLFKE